MPVIANNICTRDCHDVRACGLCFDECGLSKKDKALNTDVLITTMEYNGLDLDPGDLDGTLPADGAWAAAEGGNECGTFRSTQHWVGWVRLRTSTFMLTLRVVLCTCCCRRPLKGDIQTLHDVLQERKASLGKSIDRYYVNLSARQSFLFCAAALRFCYGAAPRHCKQSSL